MPKFSVVVPHKLGQEEALARVKNLLGDAKTKYADQISDVQENWQGNRGEFTVKAMGMNVSGAVDVTPAAVEITGDLPLLASGFKGQIEERLRERAQALLA